MRIIAPTTRTPPPSPIASPRIRGRLFGAPLDGFFSLALITWENKPQLRKREKKRKF